MHFSWQIYTDKIFRNQDLVSFHIGPLDTIVLKITPIFLGIVCIPDKKFLNREQECPLTTICSEFRKETEADIRLVTSDIDYVMLSMV